MSKAKIVGFSAFVWISVIGTLLHFTFEWSGENAFVGLFSAVNESIWEHTKLLFFPAAAFALGVSLILPKEFPSALTVFAVSVLCAMAAQTAAYYTYTGIIGQDVPFVNIAIFYACAALCSMLTVYFTGKMRRWGNVPGVLLLVGVTLCFFYWTKTPPNLPLFESP